MRTLTDNFEITPPFTIMALPEKALLTFVLLLFAIVFSFLHMAIAFYRIAYAAVFLSSK